MSKPAMTSWQRGGPRSRDEREAIIDKLEKYDQMKREAFLASFTEINKNFKQIFQELSRGDGDLVLENPEDPLAGGMTIKARPAGKALHRLEAMSGGEKSLTALSFIFSIQMYRPAPFYAMDEIDMFLDGANVERVAKLIKKISGKAQFIVVSLRKPMILQSRYTLGVTMQENNITSVTGICTSWKRRRRQKQRNHRLRRNERRSIMQEFEFGEPAEVLVELARRGEIDPWDIDIAKATEKFLQYIDSLEKRDLRIPARTLLYASILLRLKSDSMEGQKVEEPEPEVEEAGEEPEEEIEDQLPRPPVRRHTKRPVTLDELISELKKAEMVGRRKAMRERWPSTEEKALDLSHDEGIEDRIKALGPILDDMFMEKPTVTFQDINSKNGMTEDGVTNYVSLLFMAQRKQVWLEQEEIFGDLFVSRHA